MSKSEKLSMLEAAYRGLWVDRVRQQRIEDAKDLTAMWRYVSISKDLDPSSFIKCLDADEWLSMHNEFFKEK